MKQRQSAIGAGKVIPFAAHSAHNAPLAHRLVLGQFEVLHVQSFPELRGHALNRCHKYLQRSSLIVIFHQQTTAILHLHHQVPRQCHVQSLTSHVQSIVSPPVFVQHLQLGVLQQPLHGQHLPEVAGAVESSLSVYVFGSCIALVALVEDFQTLEVTVCCRCHEGSVFAEIRGVGVAPVDQNFNCFVHFSENGHHESSISFVVSALVLELLTVVFEQGQNGVLLGLVHGQQQQILILLFEVKSRPDDFSQQFGVVFEESLLGVVEGIGSQTVDDVLGKVAALQQSSQHRGKLIL